MIVKFLLQSVGVTLILVDGGTLYAHPLSMANAGWDFLGLCSAIVGIWLLEAGFKWSC